MDPRGDETLEDVSKLGFPSISQLPAEPNFGSGPKKGIDSTGIFTVYIGTTPHPGFQSPFPGL